jgi:phage terminase large subunit-like protein
MTKDRATNYATSVVNGDIVAGSYVVGACNRHINDRQKEKDDPNYPFYYDEHEASEGIAFFEECLCLNGGQFEGKPFLLIDWQAFVIGSIYGWKRKNDNTRRFRVAYIETPKGSGKSPMAAAIGLKGLVADNEPRSEVYAAATYQAQAMVLFRDAVAFYDQSELLKKRLTASGIGEKRWNLSYLATGSFFRVISSEKKGQSGPRPHVILLDEVHEHKDGTIIEMLRAGFKFRRQPLMILITNSGHDKTSVCWEYHDMGVKIACEQIVNDEFFSYICSLDENDIKDDKYLSDESLWSKVNPSLSYGIPGYDYIRSQVTEAKGLPSKMSTVKRLCFCQWVESENPAISPEVWRACMDKDYDNSILIDRKCWGGLDLSAVNDLTSFALVFEPSVEDPFWRLKVWFWVPGVGLVKKEESDHVPYIAWRDANYIIAINRASIEYEFVIADVNTICNTYSVQKIAFDRWNMKTFKKDLLRMGVNLPELEEFGQGYKSMSPAIKVFEKKLLDSAIRHDGNPCLTWNAANVVAEEDEADNKKYIKPHSGGRIDGIIAAVMACGLLEEGTEMSAYTGRTAEEMIAEMAFK